MGEIYAKIGRDTRRKSLFFLSIRPGFYTVKRQLQLHYVLRTRQVAASFSAEV